MTMEIIAVQIAVAQATVIVLQYYRLGAWASCLRISHLYRANSVRHLSYENDRSSPRWPHRRRGGLRWTCGVVDVQELV